MKLSMRVGVGSLPLNRLSDVVASAHPRFVLDFRIGWGAADHADIVMCLLTRGGDRLCT